MIIRVGTDNLEGLISAIEKLQDFEYRRSLSENIRVFIKDDEQYPYPMKVLDIYRKILSEHGFGVD